MIGAFLNQQRGSQVLKQLIATTALLFSLGETLHASEESKTWEASTKAQEFVKDTIVIGMLASPYGTGWTEYDQLHTYFQRARDNGITGHEMTVAAADMTWETLREQHYHFRSAIAEQPNRGNLERRPEAHGHAQGLGDQKHDPCL